MGAMLLRLTVGAPHGRDALFRNRAKGIAPMGRSYECGKASRPWGAPTNVARHRAHGARLRMRQGIAAMGRSCECGPVHCAH